MRGLVEPMIMTGLTDALVRALRVSHMELTPIMSIFRLEWQLTTQWCHSEHRNWVSSGSADVRGAAVHMANVQQRLGAWVDR